MATRKPHAHKPRPHKSHTRKPKSASRWGANVKTDSTHPPPGLFTKNASTIARTLASKMEAELRVIHPQITVCLGATAAQSVFGPDYRLTKERGKFVTHRWAPQATSMIHPSAILHAPGEEHRHLEYQRFVEDLKKVEAAALNPSA
jgi:uracil-DNA glycosylase family 4